MSAPRFHAPRLAYLVSAYPAVSHTFILRELQGLRARGLQIVTASINRPDRALGAMEAAERQEAHDTYCLKADGVVGALRALAYWTWTAPGALLRTLRMGLAMGCAGCWWRGLAYAVEAAMVARWMRREQTRHLHVHFGNMGASVGVLARTLDGCHLSLTVHGPDEFDDVPGQQLALKMAQADAVVCISQFAIGQLMRISQPGDWPKLRLCRLGVDPSLFRFTLRDAGSPARLLCVGRLTPAKGQVLLIQACARLREAGMDFRLTLVGAGPDRALVEATVAALGLQGRVGLTGALSQQAVRDEFARADIFVLPSLAEGIPVVLMEAMSCGLPCVTTPVNGIPELVESGVTGLLTRPGDVDALAEALARLIKDPALRHRLALAARDKVAAEFDLDRNIDALASFFAQLLPPRRPHEPGSAAPIATPASIAPCPNPTSPS